MGIVSSLVAIGFSTFWASTIAYTAASIGLSFLAQKLAGKPKIDQAEFGVKGQLQRGADVPQAFIVGTYATAGSLTYANTSGHENRWMTWVITLSDLPAKRLVGIWVNGQDCPLLDLDGPLKSVGGFNDKLLVRFFDGTQTVADPWVTDEVSTAERPFDASAVGTGKAYVVVRAHLDEELFRNGFPQFLFVVEGIPLYNIAKDSSAGGDGPQRWSNPATWESSDNPAVQLYNLLRGIRYKGEWFYGLQDVTEAQLPSLHWREQIEKCWQPISGAGGMQNTYRSSAEIPVSAQIHEVIGSLLDACSGRLSDAGGVYKLFAGEPLPSIASFSDADIISTSEQSFTPFLGLADTVNGVVAKYPSPEAGWQTETAPPLYRSDYEEADGGRRLLVNVDLDFVPYAEQAQRLMKSALNEARRARRHTITLPPEYWTIEAGDTITWTSERNGYVAKQFRVDGIVDMPDADVLIDITEVDPSDYDWNSGVDFTPPAVPGVTDQPIPVQEVQGFGVEAASVRSADYINRVPAIRAFWNPDVADTRAIKMELRIQETQEQVDPATSETPEDGEVFISAGILPDSNYEVRAKFIPKSPRPTEWTVWHHVKTWDIKMEPDYISDLTWDKIEQDAIDIADGILDDFENDIYFPTIDLIEADINQWQIDQVSITDVVGEANQHIIDALLLYSQTQSLVSDAGIYVDPNTSEVRISGVDANADRIGTAEIRLSGAESAINLRATEVYVDNAINNAVLDPSQVPIIGNLETRISNVEIDMSAAESAILLKADQTTVNGYGLRLDQAEIDIDALDGRISLKVDQTEFDDVETRIQMAETELSLLDGPTIRQTVADTRYLYERLDTDSITDLEALLNAYEGREELKTGIAYATQEMRAAVDDERQATASIVQALGVAIDSNEALIEAERIVRANETSANAQDITTLVSRVGDAEGNILGQADAISNLVTDVQNVDGRVTASASDITQLQSQVDDVDGLAGGNATAIGGLSTRVSNAEGEISSQANSITSLSTTVGQHTTSISQTMSAVNGINAKYALKITNNGVVTGFGLTSSNAGGSQFAIQADKMMITNGTNQQVRQSPFIVYTSPQTIGGETMAAGVYMRDAFIRNAAVTTVKIRGNSVTVPAVQNRDNVIQGQGGFVEANRLSVTLDYPGYVQAHWVGQVGYDNVVYDTLLPNTFRIKMNSIVVFARYLEGVNNIATGSIMKYFNPGKVTVQVEWSGSLPRGNRTIRLVERSLTVMGVKR